MWRRDRAAPAIPGTSVFFNRSPENRLLRKPHLFLAEIGGDPGAVSPELAFAPGQDPSTNMVITDDFLRDVGEGAVRVKRTATLCFDERGVIFADGTRSDLDTVVMCTGYTTTLPFLDKSVLTAVEFEASDQLQPTLLHKQVFHPALPGLYFVGHYRGPYFSIMELQARWIAAHSGGGAASALRRGNAHWYRRGAEHPARQSEAAIPVRRFCRPGRRARARGGRAAATAARSSSATLCGARAR